MKQIYVLYASLWVLRIKCNKLLGQHLDCNNFNVHITFSL
jgi:hypothetical protein